MVPALRIDIFFMGSLLSAFARIPGRAAGYRAVRAAGEAAARRGPGQVCGNARGGYVSNTAYAAEGM